MLIAKKMLIGIAGLHQDVKAMKQAYIEGSKVEKNRLLHRDIKPENMLVDGSLNATHIDYGFVKKLGKDEQAAKDFYMGTPYFIAPEIIRSRLMGSKEKVEYGVRTEIYALGVAFMELLDLNREQLVVYTNGKIKT